jgi:hypothetical protein
MGLFDSKSSTTANDLADNSNASAANDLIDIGQVSGSKNTQEVDLSRKATDGGDLVNLGNVHARNSSQTIDSSRSDSRVTDSFNTRLDGYAGNSGTFNITDGGAIDAMQKVVSAFSNQTTKQLQTTQALAQSVSSGGQTVVAETSARMIKYISIGLGIVGLAFVANKVFK